MSPLTNALAMTVATLLMVLGGIVTKRLEWKPRDDDRDRRSRRPPGATP